MNEAMRSPCHSCIKDRFDNGILDPSCGHIAGSRSQIVEAQNYAAKATKCHKTIHWLTPPSSICEDDRCTPIHRLHRQRFRCASFGLRLKPGTQGRFGEIGSLHIYTSTPASTETLTCDVHCSNSAQQHKQNSTCLPSHLLGKRLCCQLFNFGKINHVNVWTTLPASTSFRIPRTSPSVRSPNALKAFSAAFSAATAFALAGSIVPSNGKSCNSSKRVVSSSTNGSSPSGLSGSGGGSKGSSISLLSTTFTSRSFFTLSVAASTSRWHSSERTSTARWNSSKAASWRTFLEAKKFFWFSKRFSRNAKASLPTFTIGIPPPRRSQMSNAAAPVTGAGTPAAPWWNTASRLLQHSLRLLRNVLDGRQSKA